ncbi:hypothetical protein F7725_004878 [Dissostichus mawsoni]|uniref:DNA/RNA non-specific endonuclease/pyrophosphatase/phosphodiesterase domain-containing protein n=1 Tax=Dissostichus mawsoni TaxID=36200 RepID=A0A7J5XK34_DISMA|nr:hypothetical protein F7725_004878 [Dissostichus mawsoni]
MACLKKWSIPPLAALLLLLSVVPTGSEVVGSMSECAEFLLNETPPNVPGILEEGNILDQNRYKPICQTFGGIRRYVTLYDTKNKIPVFSASRYIGTNSKRPENEDWKIEPQLEDIHGNENMRKDVEGKTYNNQAVNSDYTNQGFDRGHLFPSSYASTEDDKSPPSPSPTLFHRMDNIWHSFYHIWSTFYNIWHSLYHICRSHYYIWPTF